MAGPNLLQTTIEPIPLETATAIEPILLQTAAAIEPILLQTAAAIEPNTDRHIGRFSLLRDYLAGSKAADGAPLTDVVAPDRAPIGQPYPARPIFSQPLQETKQYVRNLTLWLAGRDADTAVRKS
jgi:hypothetical protein